MKNKLQNLLTGVLFFLCLLSIANFAHARTVWVKGEVTQGVWHSTYRYVMVDNKKYTFMPEAVLHKRCYDHSAKSWYEEECSFNNVRTGQKTMIRVQGRRIYEMIIFD